MILAVGERVKEACLGVVTDDLKLSLIAGLGATLVMVSHLVFLTKYPAVFLDEPWEANVAWNWLKVGIRFDDMHSGTLDQLGYESVRWPLIGKLPWLVSFATLGLGLFQARLVSGVLGVLLLVATFMVGRRSYGVVTGALAALLLSLSPPFIQASRYVRPDIMLGAVVMAAYHVAQRAWDEDRWWAHALAGFLIGLSVDIHENAMMFAVGLAAAYLAAYGREVFQKAGTWLCAGGGLLGGVFYLAVRVLPNPRVYFLLRGFNIGSTEQLPLQTLNPVDLLESVIQEVGRYHFYDNNLEFALIGTSVAYLLMRRFRADRLLLVFVSVAFAGFVLIAGNKNDIYAILLYPFFTLMVAEALVSLIRLGRNLEPLHVFAASLLMLFLVKSVVHYARPLAQHRDYDYYAVTSRIERAIPPEGRVMGTPFWWLGLADYDYRSSLNLTYYHHYNGYDLVEGLEAIRPDVIILDEMLSGMRVPGDGFPPGPGFQVYNLPGQEFNDFLAKRGEKVDEFTDPWHGKFEIYAIHWP